METDQYLVTRTCQGEREAFAGLVDRYKARIFHTTLRMLKNREDAEEAAQDTFLRAYRGLPNFRADASFSTWLYKICYNVCLSYLERKKIKYAVSEEETLHLPDPETPDKLFENHELEDLVGNALAELPVIYRSALVLYHAQHLSYQEIAEITGQPINSVKTHLFRGRALLRERILKLQPEEAWLASE
jgi:RNA polymerase sigma-70 factor (ECF subfamily)